MLIWKKPIAILVATTGIFVGAAGTEFASAQSTDVSNNTFHNFSDLTSVPTPAAKPLRHVPAVFERFGEPAQQAELSSPPKQTTVLAQAKDIPNFGPRLNQGTSSQFQSTGFAAPQESTSQETENPAAETRENLAEPKPDTSVLDLDIEKIQGVGEDQAFAIRLHVPDSVKVIEVTPQSSRDGQKNFKIQLDQLEVQSSQQDGLITSNYSMPKTPAAQSSNSFNTVRPHSEVQPSRSNMRPAKWIPVNTETPTRRGFQKNPFFQPAKTQGKPVALAPVHDIPLEVPEMFVPPIISSVGVDSGPELASYHAVLSDSSSAQQTSYQTSHVAVNVTAAAISGPALMGLGDIGDFTIQVNNPSTDTIENVTVKLDIPSGLEVVLLDREAEFDGETSTLSWQIDELTPMNEMIIRYRVKTLHKGDQNHRVRVGCKNAGEIASEHNTSVVVAFESPGAPLLPFESNQSSVE